MKRNFKGKVVIITGVCGGLGKALAKRFIEAGSKVIGTDINKEEVEKLRLEEPSMDVYVNDVTNEKEILEIVNIVINKYHGIDLLINNAGISHLSHFPTTSTEVMRRVMNINFFGAAYWTSASIYQLMRKKGMVICISSVTGYAPLYARSIYCASKHALHGCFESLRTEVKDFDVDVMMVCPSFIETKINDNALSGDGKSAQVNRVHAGKKMSPQDAANKIFVAATKSKKMLLLGRVSKLSYILNKISKSLYAFVMKQKFAKELRPSFDIEKSV